MVGDERRCTCQAEGKYPHSIDGESYWLCPKCHAVLKCIITNVSALDAASFLLLSNNTGDRRLLDIWENEEVQGVAKEELEEMPEVAENEEEVLEYSVFVGVSEDHNEVKREPPRRDDDAVSY